MIKSILCGFLVILLAEQSSAIQYRNNPYSASNYVNPKVTTPFVPIEWSTINNSVKGAITAEATELIKLLEAARKVEPYLYKSYNKVANAYDLDPYNQRKVYKYSADDSSANYNYDYQLYGKVGYQYFSPRKDVAQYGEDYNSYSQKYENHYDGSYTQEKPYEKNYHAEPYQKLHPEPYSKTYKEHHSEPYSKSYHSEPYKSESYHSEPYKSESYHSEPYKSESYRSEPYHSESYSKEYSNSYPEPYSKSYRSEPYSSEYSKSYPEPYSKSSYPDHYSKPYSSEYSKSYPEHKEKRYSERYRTLKAKVLQSEKMKSANIPFAKKLSARAIKLRNEFY